MEAGISQVDFLAFTAFLILVNKSAIGSVVIIISSPTRLRDAGDLAGMDELAKADAAQHELAVHRLRATATATARVRAHLELRLVLLLLDQSLLCHAYC